jgi:enoyl-CoA hydratase/carnithine racemase
MTYQHLLYGVDSRVATITLERPERHNTLRMDLC